MFSAVSGLRVHQTKMDVIANNIANVNTTGYKSSRVTFYDVFNQTISGASQADADRGTRGRNPMQIGLGTNVASIDQIMTTGAAQRTDWVFDLMIQGEGFFVLQDETGQNFFTRAGAFRVDESGNITNSSGMAVCGWTRVQDSLGRYVIEPGKISPLKITADMEFADPEPTSDIKIDGNLNVADGGSATASGFVSTMAFYDTLGTRYIVDIEYKYQGNNIWTATIANQAALASDPDITFDFPMSWDSFPTAPGAADPLQSVAPMPATPNRTLHIAFDRFGTLQHASTTPITVGGTPPAPVIPAPDLRQTEMRLIMGQPDLASLADDIDINVADAGFGKTIYPATGKTSNNQISIDLTALGQKAMNTNATATPLNGKEPGRLTQTSIGEDGIIRGIYSNGTSEVLGQIVLTQFKNPAGLEKVGGSVFRATGNSGYFDGIGIAPGTSGTTLLSGVLEMSNVDLSQEFSEMIVTQRGFQSNSRIMSTSDEMLQELVNLKR